MFNCPEGSSGVAFGRLSSKVPPPRHNTTCIKGEEMINKQKKIHSRNSCLKFHSNSIETLIYRWLKLVYVTRHSIRTASSPSMPWHVAFAPPFHGAYVALCHVDLYLVEHEAITLGSRRHQVAWPSRSWTTSRSASELTPRQCSWEGRENKGVGRGVM
jgi:hypothetical protein